MGDMGFADKFLLPGGKVERRETPEQAVVRECKEEVGIEIFNLGYLGNFLVENEYKRDTLHCFTAKAKSLDVKIDNFEIVEARWFPISALPQLSPITKKILEIGKLI